MTSFILIALGVLALGVSLFQSLMTWEFWRLMATRLAERIDPSSFDQCPVSVIIPVKGCFAELEGNLRAHLDQDYPRYEIVFVVESVDDPAVRIIRKLLSGSQPVPMRMVVAGVSSTTGQKIHNLQAAIASLHHVIQVIAFADDDIRPDRDWLKRLVFRQYSEDHGASTSYPIHLPARMTLPNLFTFSSTSSVYGLSCRHAFCRIAGPSWAVKRSVFAECGIGDKWNETLSDDLVASRAIRDRRLRIEFEQGSVSVKPMDLSYGQAIEYLRRQLKIVRFYARGYWWLALIATTSMQVGFWGCSMAAVWSFLTGHMTWGVFAAVTLLLYALSVLRAWMRHRALSMRLSAGARLPLALRSFDALCSPISSLLTWLILVSSAWGRSLKWRNIRYDLTGNGKIIRISRSNHALDGARDNASIHTDLAGNHS